MNHHSTWGHPSRKPPVRTFTRFGIALIATLAAAFALALVVG